MSWIIFSPDNLLKTLYEKPSFIFATNIPINYLYKNVLWLYFSKDIWMHFQNWLHWAMKVVGSNPHHWRQSWIHIPPALIFSIPAPPAYFQSISSSSVLFSHQYWTKMQTLCIFFKMIATTLPDNIKNDLTNWCHR